MVRVMRVGRRLVGRRSVFGIVGVRATTGTILRLRCGWWRWWRLIRRMDVLLLLEVTTIRRWIRQGLWIRWRMVMR